MSLSLSPDGRKAFPNKISRFLKSNDTGMISAFNSEAILKNPVFHSKTFDRVPSGDNAIIAPSISLI